MTRILPLVRRHKPSYPEFLGKFVPHHSWRHCCPSLVVLERPGSWPKNYFTLVYECKLPLFWPSYPTFCPSWKVPVGVTGGRVLTQSVWVRFEFAPVFWHVKNVSGFKKVNRTGFAFTIPKCKRADMSKFGFSWLYYSFLCWMFRPQWEECKVHNCLVCQHNSPASEAFWILMYQPLVQCRTVDRMFEHNIVWCFILGKLSLGLNSAWTCTQKFAKGTYNEWNHSSTTSNFAPVVESVFWSRCSFASHINPESHFVWLTFGNASRLHAATASWRTWTAACAMLLRQAYTNRLLVWSGLIYEFGLVGTVNRWKRPVICSWICARRIFEADWGMQVMFSITHKREKFAVEWQFSHCCPCYMCDVQRVWPEKIRENSGCFCVCSTNPETSSCLSLIPGTAMHMLRFRITRDHCRCLALDVSNFHFVPLLLVLRGEQSCAVKHNGSY